MNFIFTQRKESKYGGGWTTVDAANVDQAIALYRIFHPDRKPPYVDCLAIYSESAFLNTEAHRKGNNGRRTVERISVIHMEVNNGE